MGERRPGCLARVWRDSGQTLLISGPCYAHHNTTHYTLIKNQQEYKGASPTRDNFTQDYNVDYFSDLKAFL